ncbi:ABC transporter substrate-binding protein [Streptacidiphilus pinicola]|uniref:ABC transporter substrate-binding protein n=1 Tax=Streptacidiphilus pinicola TaxID=2219663 RepID=A0A2X0I7R3_9ACTN|nr:ABC transporter substrate-binding protein [Streptacidiphilus pinicola]RAG80992.1 ABC transporter substrate-binding protein [Streptacidiphilus pinicola]
MRVQPSRRTFLAAGGVAGLGALLAACGAGAGSGSGSSGGDAAASRGTWRFTDDRGATVSLPHAPTRVVAYTGTAAALHDFGAADRVVGVFGPTKLADGRTDPMAGQLDVAKLTVLGNAWGEFDLEKYAALRPQLLVTDMWQPKQLWYVPDATKDKIAALAPTAGISIAHVQLPEPLRRHEELARLLGADLTAASVVAAKQRFQQAVETLRRTAKARGGLKVLAASAGADLLYVSDPAVYPDLAYYRSLGVELIAPDKVQGGFFESLSWENADKYGADLILLDSRSSALQPKDLTGKPTWRQLPAVKAGQVVPWLSEVRFSYAGCAPLVEQLAGALDRARQVAR